MILFNPYLARKKVKLLRLKISFTVVWVYGYPSEHRNNQNIHLSIIKNEYFWKSNCLMPEKKVIILFPLVIISAFKSFKSASIANYLIDVTLKSQRLSVRWLTGSPLKSKTLAAVYSAPSPLTRYLLSPTLHPENENTITPLPPLGWKERITMAAIDLWVNGCFPEM